MTPDISSLFHGASNALISECGLYRHGLSRDCGGGPPLLSIGLNPSTADHTLDDNTIRKDKKFTRAWGFGWLIKANAYDYRSTDPKAMFAAKRNCVPIISEHCDSVLVALAEEVTRLGGKIWVAWGGNIEPFRQQYLAQLLGDYELWCIKTNKDGSPVHELYQPDASVLQRWP